MAKHVSGLGAAANEAAAASGAAAPRAAAVAAARPRARLLRPPNVKGTVIGKVSALRILGA